MQPTTAPVTTADLQPEPDLDRLRTQLTAAEEQVRAATADAQAAAGRAVGAQIARTSALQAAEAARLALRDEVRQSLTDGPLATVPSWAVAPDVGSVGLLGEIRTRSVHKRADQAAVVRRASDQLDAATRTLDAARDAAIRDAGEAVLAADRARRLMDAAQRISAANDVVRSQLEAQRRALDALNDALVRSLAPVQRPAAEAAAPSSPGRAPRPEAVDTFPDGTKPDASASAQAAVLRILEATPLGQVPAGYATTGQVFQGEASWYGPGFVGSPTSTGVPYDPEKLTCAMLMVPLGSVVRVTSESGASVVLLVKVGS